MSRKHSDDNAAGNDDREYQGERLQRVLAQRGVASRRASEQLMRDGRVKVNGKVVATPGTRVNPNRDEIQVDGTVLKRQPPRYIVLNKPAGFITTVSDERDRWTVMDLVDVRERVYPVGRLDRATQGLVLLTNDGDLAHRIMHPRYRIDKEYLVFTGERPTGAQLQRLREGVTIDGRRVVPTEVRLFRESPEGTAIRIIVHEGIYHLVRRMMESVDIGVDRLRRVRMGPLRIQGIPSGAWRDLTPGELIQLYEAVGLPASEADAANSKRPIIQEPVGGFSHGAAPGATRQPPAGENLRTGQSRQPRPDRTRQSRGRGNRHDNVRSSQGRRDRRSRRRR